MATGLARWERCADFKVSACESESIRASSRQGEAQLESVERHSGAGISFELSEALFHDGLDLRIAWESFLLILYLGHELVG